jgi:hypothetical protein
MKYQLYFDEPTDMEQIRAQVEAGGRFVVYSYCISLIAVALTKLSPAILILSEESHKRHRNKYNLLTALFGWWAFPYGPFRSVEIIRSNNKGGFDVTEDIMLNLREEHLITGEIDLVETNMLFSEPEYWDLKAFEKTLTRYFEEDSSVLKIVVGMYVNTAEYEEVTRTIGIEVKVDFEGYVEKMKTTLRKEFKRGTTFKFIDLAEQSKIGDFLQKQGTTLFNKSSGI